MRWKDLKLFENNKSNSYVHPLAFDKFYAL